MLLFNEVLKKGFDGNHFITGLSSHFRDLLVSRDEQTLQLLEVGASIRERYKAQAQKCEQKFLYKAMKLCNDCDLNYYWREFATRLPKEEAANAGRMMNMSPKLLDDQTTFEVAVDNEMVQKYMQQLAPQIENHLREQLHNRKIRMTVRGSAADENIRAYSHVERFQMMSKKNPNLLKLKEDFGLELS